MSAPRTPSAALAVMSLIVGIVVGLLGAVPAAADPDPLPPAPSPEPAQKGAAAPPPAPPPAPPVPVLVAPVQAVPTHTPSPAHPPPDETLLTPGPDADSRFLALASQIPGVVITDPNAVVASARGMCTAMQYGLTPDQEVTMSENNTGLTHQHAQDVVAAAIVVYCPYLAHRR